MPPSSTARIRDGISPQFALWATNIPPSSTVQILADRVEAGAEITDWVTQGMRIRRNSPPAGGGVAVLHRRGGGSDGIVRITYANNPGKLAAWISASHIERAPSKLLTP